MQAAPQPDGPGYARNGAGTDGPDMTATDFDSCYARSRIVTGHQVRSPTAQRFCQDDRGAAMQNTKRLLRSFIHRHLATDKIRPDSGDTNAENAFDSHLDLVVHLDQAYRRLADVLVQNSATRNKKTAQAYHSGPESAKMCGLTWRKA